MKIKNFLVTLLFILFINIPLSASMSDQDYFYFDRWLDSREQEITSENFDYLLRNHRSYPITNYSISSVYLEYHEQFKTLEIFISIIKLDTKIPIDFDDIAKNTLIQICKRVSSFLFLNDQIHRKGKLWMPSSAIIQKIVFTPDIKSSFINNSHNHSLKFDIDVTKLFPEAIYIKQ
jgi:hypothetical protein